MDTVERSALRAKERQDETTEPSKVQNDLKPVDEEKAESQDGVQCLQDAGNPH